jgi:hypothetical protein
MSDSAGPSGRQQIDLREVEDWRDPLDVSFDQAASLEIAKWVLWIFAGVYALCFGLAFIAVFRGNIDFESSFKLVQLMLTSILPLVTLAVGYYLGDRGRAAGA